MAVQSLSVTILFILLILNASSLSFFSVSALLVPLCVGAFLSWLTCWLHIPFMSSSSTLVQNLLTIGTPSNVTEKMKLKFGLSHQENQLHSGEGQHTEKNSEVSMHTSGCILFSIHLYFIFSPFKKSRRDKTAAFQVCHLWTCTYNAWATGTKAKGKKV